VKKMDHEKMTEEILDLKTQVVFLTKKVEALVHLLEQEGVLRESDIDEIIKEKG
jgi:hypothetical protein